ncbi:RAP protein, putative [Plasmodium relictum]|uniref:RAP protein, putative n=1 Tax=Plasmodium relictum TaxID=85471 RepID=A0A1J1HB82_PLARL|nr:RAP protein, putative [Plasmodium relictum]CRH00848.1 RAP protein, putative [Plasmodium relictum]
MFVHLLKNYNIASLLRREKSKCIFFIYIKRTSLSSLKKNDNLLKNLCNKNVINNLDSLYIIENLKYVSDNNVGKDIIKIYVNKIKLLNERWNLNKIYLILKTLKKYDIYDVVLLNKLENIIDKINIYQKAEMDHFENIYIIRISYVLHTFYYFNHANENVVKKLIEILSNKLDYIIYHNNYFNNFLYKFLQTSKNESNTNYNLNNIKINDIHLKFEKKKNENVFVKNISFNEIYLTLNILKKLKYYDKDFINKLKFLYYFNVMDIDKTNENDYKYSTLLFNHFYQNDDKYLLNIITLFLSKNTNIYNIHDLVLILVTVYYSEIQKKEDHNKFSSNYKNSKIKQSQGDNIINIIDSINFLSEEQKKNLKFILFSICKCNIKSDDLNEIIYEKVLNLLSLKYQDDLNKRISNFSKKENEKSDNIFRSNEDNSFKDKNIKNITNDLQSLSELIKISNYSLKEVNILYYIYMKNFVEIFNIETILNIFKSFIFVYNISNESTKNYSINLKGRNRNIICYNLNNLMNIVILIITTKSLYRLYNMCNIGELSYVLYFLYQISNIFENKVHEELYLKKIHDHINSIIIMKLKLILKENETENLDNTITYNNLEKNDENYMNNIINNSIDSNEYLHKDELYSKKKYINYENSDLFNNKINVHDRIVNEENSIGKNSKEEIIDAYSILFNLYSKKGDNKKILILLIKILQKSQIENKNLQTGIYINLLNSFAKLKYRNLKFIEMCLNKINENSESLNFYEYINLLISLSKLNIFGINLNIYNNTLFSLEEKKNNNNNCKFINEIFINEFNNVKGFNNIGIVYKLTKIFRKINESISNFVFFPNFKIINIIPNILNAYTILGFDKIHFKNVNKLLECFHDYIFNYFENNKLDRKNNNYINDKQNNDDYNEIIYNINNTFNKNHYWYFSEKNNIIITKEGNDRKLYLPLQCLYQLYIFNIYFNLYIRYLFDFYKNEKDNQNATFCNEIREDSYYLSNYLHRTNLYSMNKHEINDKKNYSFFNVSNILSEKSVHLLNNIIFFAKYINNFYKNNYKKYNLYVEYLNSYKNYDENSTLKKNNELIEYIKNYDVNVNIDNSVTYPSSFHRDVFSTLKSLGVKNIECEVPFLDGIYTIDIIINSSICIEINGNNHYYYDNNMKRSYEKLDSLNLIKYYLLSKRYKLIVVSNLEWNNMKTINEKKEFLKKKIEI